MVWINFQAVITRIPRVEVEEDTAGDRETITRLKEIGEIRTHQGDSKTGMDMLFPSQTFEVERWKKSDLQIRFLGASTLDIIFAPAVCGDQVGSVHSLVYLSAGTLAVQDSGLPSIQNPIHLIVTSDGQDWRAVQISSLDPRPLPSLGGWHPMAETCVVSDPHTTRMLCFQYFLTVAAKVWNTVVNLDQWIYLWLILTYSLYDP